MKPQNYPAAAAYLVNLLMAAVVAFHIMNAMSAHWVSVVVVAVTSLVVAFMVHPFILASATGAFQTLIVALGGFGLHWNDTQVSAAVAIFGLIVAVVTHSLVIPMSAHVKGTTVTDMERLGARRVAA